MIRCNCLSVFVCTKRGIIWGTIQAPKALMTPVKFPLSILMARRFLIHRLIIMMVLVVSWYGEQILGNQISTMMLGVSVALGYGTVLRLCYPVLCPSVIRWGQMSLVICHFLQTVPLTCQWNSLCGISNIFVCG